MQRSAQINRKIQAWSWTLGESKRKD